MVNRMKPCPFCGGPPKIENINGKHAIWCAVSDECPAVVDVCMNTRDLAIAAWNARAGNGVDAGEVERLVDAYGRAESDAGSWAASECAPYSKVVEAANKAKAARAALIEHVTGKGERNE